MEIRLRQCVLRPLVPSDAPALARHANDREIWLKLRDRFPHPYTLADARAYIELSARTPPPVTSFGIVVNGEAAGGISLMPGADVERYSAEIGYWLERAYWGRGVVTAAVRAVTEYAFGSWGWCGCSRCRSWGIRLRCGCWRRRGFR